MTPQRILIPPAHPIGSPAGVEAAPRKEEKVGERRWTDLMPRLLAVLVAWPLLLAAVLLGPAWIVGVIAVPAIFLAAREVHRLSLSGWPSWSTAQRALFVAGAGLLVPAFFPLLRIWRGPEAALLAILVSWGGDCGAYLVGRSLGRHLVSARVSSRKTWEGAAGSFLTALVLAGLFRAAGLIPLSGMDLWVTAGAANLLAQSGDLAESALKRRAGARHSGRLFPGGGGVLDSLDSLSPASGGLLLFF